MISVRNIWAALTDAQSHNIYMPLVGDGAPTSGTSGTGVNIAGKGCGYIDFTNANWYINAGSITSPTWKLITRAA